MSSENIINLFWQFGLAGILGFLIGLEREMRDEQTITLGIRDFVLFCWASFNLVLGALSNTFMKLLLIFSLGHRALFKHLLLSFLVIGAVGLVTMFLYYDIGLKV